MTNLSQVLLFCPKKYLEYVDNSFSFLVNVDISVSTYLSCTFPWQSDLESAFEWGIRHAAPDSLWIVITDEEYGNLPMLSKFNISSGTKNWKLIHIYTGNDDLLESNDELSELTTPKLLGDVIGGLSLMLLHSSTIIPEDVIAEFIDSGSEIRCGIYQFIDGTTTRYSVKSNQRSLTNLATENRELMGIVRFGKAMTQDEVENRIRQVVSIENEGKNITFGYRVDSSLRSKCCNIYFVLK